MESHGDYQSLYELEASERNLKPRVQIDSSEIHISDSVLIITASGTYKFDCMAEHEGGPLVLMCSMSEVKEAIGLECKLNDVRLELGTQLKMIRPVKTKREINASPLVTLPSGAVVKRAVTYLHTTAPILQLFGPFPDTLTAYQLAHEFPGTFTFDRLIGSVYDPFFMEAKGRTNEGHD